MCGSLEGSGAGSPSHWQQRLGRANRAEKALSSLRARHGIAHSVTVGGSSQEEVDTHRPRVALPTGESKRPRLFFAPHFQHGPPGSSNQIGDGISSLAATFTALTALQSIDFRSRSEHTHAPRLGPGYPIISNMLHPFTPSH
jgi:hypothetical protein